MDGWRRVNPRTHPPIIIIIIIISLEKLQHSLYDTAATLICFLHNGRRTQFRYGSGYRCGSLLFKVVRNAFVRFGTGFHGNINGRGVCLKYWNLAIFQCACIGRQKTFAHANEPDIVPTATTRHVLLVSAEMINTCQKKQIPINIRANETSKTHHRAKRISKHL